MCTCNAYVQNTMRMSINRERYMHESWSALMFNVITTLYGGKKEPQKLKQFAWFHIPQAGCYHFQMW